jgi:hypothetical protein
MSKRERGGPAADISTLVTTLLEKNGMQTQIQRYRAWLCWDDVVGPQIAQHARPLRLRDELLEVRVDQAAWMQQLQLLKPMIIKKLNERLGADTIRDLFLKRGPVPPPPAPKETPRSLPPLTASELARIDAELAGIQDPDLRSQLANLMALDLQQKKNTSRQ